MVDLIKRGKGVLIEKQSSRISIFNLYLEGKESQEAASIAPKLKVVYDFKRKTLVTALPLDGPTKFDAEEEIKGV